MLLLSTITLAHHLQTQDHAGEDQGDDHAGEDQGDKNHAITVNGATS